MLADFNYACVGVGVKTIWPVNKIWRRIAVTPRCWRWRIQLAGNHSDYRLLL